VLTDAKIRQAKQPVKGQSTLADEAGMYIIIRANGSKLWRYRFKWHGKEVLMALGEYPDVSLQMARDHHMEARRKRAAGISPQEEKKTEKVTGATLREVWYESWKGNKSERYRDYVLRRMEDDVYPDVGRLRELSFHRSYALGTVAFRRQRKRGCGAKGRSFCVS